MARRRKPAARRPPAAAPPAAPAEEVAQLDTTQVPVAPPRSEQTEAADTGDLSVIPAAAALVALHHAADALISGIIREAVEDRAPTAAATADRRRRALAVIDDLSDRAPALIEQAVSDGMDDGVRTVRAFVARRGGTPRPDYHAAELAARVQIIADAQQRAADAYEEAKPKIDASIRQIAARAAARVISEGQSTEQAAADLAAAVQDAGLSSTRTGPGGTEVHVLPVVGSDGKVRQHRLGPWAERHVRTATAYARNHATAGHMLAHGLRYVFITYAAAKQRKTDICDRYAGRVFSLLPEDEHGVPFLDPSEYPPLHPNCGHFMIPAGDVPGEIAL